MGVLRRYQKSQKSCWGRYNSRRSSIRSSNQWFYTFEVPNYELILSVDVERRIYFYKNMLADNCLLSLLEKLLKYLIFNCNVYGI